MIEIKMSEEEEMPPKNNSREEAHSIIKLLVNAYNMGYEDGVEAYRAMMEIEKEEKEEDAKDCISRQAVIYYIKPYIQEIITESGVDKNERTNRMLRAIINGIETMPTGKEEPAEWIVNTDETRRWDRVRFYCSSCNSWNTYGKSKYCPNCGRRMRSEGLQREDS